MAEILLLEKKKTLFSKDKFEEYVNENFRDPEFNVNSILDHFNIFPEELCYFCKTRYYMFPKVIIKYYRIKEAINLIFELKDEVERLSGYESLLNLNKHFQQLTGITLIQLINEIRIFPKRKRYELKKILLDRVYERCLYNDNHSKK